MCSLTSKVNYYYYYSQFDLIFSELIKLFENVQLKKNHGTNAEKMGDLSINYQLIYHILTCAMSLYESYVRRVAFNDDCNDKRYADSMHSG